MAESLGQLIRDRRRQTGMSQEAFAKLLGDGVRQSEVSRLESGLIRQPHPERLHRIAAILGIPVGKLLMLTSWGSPELNSVGPVRCSSTEDPLHTPQATVDVAKRILDSETDRRQTPSGTSD
jgi:transcriptional regulator with XRE-family HTH domain